MRRLAFVLVTSMLGCASDGHPGTDPTDGGVDTPSETPAFQISTPPVDLLPGEDLTYCYYFRTSNTADLAIKQWSSHMTAGSEFMIVYLTTTDMQTPGSLSTIDCGIASIVGPVWAYAAVTPDAQMTMPDNDGENNPIGQPIRAGQSGFIQMHLMNTTAAPLRAHVELNAFAYRDGVQATSAGTFVALNRQVSLDSGSPTNPTTATVGGNCDIRPDTSRIPKFFQVTTHTYKQSVRTFVKDGDAMLFNSTNWANPGSMNWGGPEFHTFASGKFTYQCEYKNPNNYSIMNGNVAKSDELCMAIGYYFPSAGGHFCLNSAMLF